MKKENRKIIISIILLVIFQCGLYLIAKLTPFEYHVMNCDLDSYIPFISVFIYPYIIWYITLFLVPYIFYKYDKNYYNLYKKTIIISLIITFFIYIFYPTTMVRSEVVPNSLSTLIVSLIYKIDTPVINCLPSVHCLISFVHIYITVIIKKMNIRLKVSILLQSVLVILATLFIKQHVIIDVIFAFIISIIVYLSIYFYVKKNLTSAKS